MSVAKPHHIIAIGASAGGMEEINVFFDHTPLDGVSYVIVQHLSADFKSRMVELLARHSKLVVKEAVDGMTVINNEVYLIPSNKHMTIRDGCLYLTDKEKNTGVHLTINTFFNSLAQDCGNRAIGVILSGLGSDGTAGTIAIKQAGGMVIARNPENAEFGSMPSSAIATGLVDFVLEPAQMPAAIETYINDASALAARQNEDEQKMAEIIDLIKARSPLDFSNYKPATILRRTKRRAAHYNFPTLQGYFDFLKTTPEEIEMLTKEFLISVTAFFRDKEAFEIIEQEVLPDILKKLLPGEELKIWVAGCATGEEAYSMAILIAEQLKDTNEDRVVKIFATDIDSDALFHAGKGIYSSSISNDVSPAWLEKYFLKEKDTYRVKPVIRKMLIFAQHDMVKNPPYCNMHLISCRNLLIYMTPVLQKKIFAMLLFGLKRNAYLFLGSSESPMPIIRHLQVIHKKWKIYMNLETRKTISMDAFALPDFPENKPVAPYPGPQYGAVNETHTLGEIMHERLAEEMDYFAVCINESNQVVKSYGNANKYLLQKHFTSNLPDLLPKPLAMAFSILSRKILKTNETAFLNSIEVKSDALELRVNLSMSRMIVKGGQNLFLLTFKEDLSTAVMNESIIFDEKLHLDQYVSSLEDESKELKDKLTAANEKLNASNENMQSFNEELISSNEEMQSTNEEMQSVNEELHTINSDYQLKNKELLEINDDLNNYFRSNVNGQLFINNDLLLMKFSPGTVKQINLLESDIGRPLSNISTNIKFETIIDDIKKVLAEGVVITKEIETNNGKWYQIMTMPYVQMADHKNNGAIITFNDITELKKIQLELDISKKMLEMAIESASMGMWSINIKTREFIPSPRFKEIFGFYANEEMSYQSTIAQINEEYQSLVTDAVETCINGGEKCDVEYPIRGLHDDKIKWVRSVGNISHSKEDKPVYFTGVLQDITEHKLGDIRKNDFIALVSHELKTPLTTIQAYAQILTEKAKVDGEVFSVTSLGKVIIQVKKMSALINGFLSASSFEAGKIYLNEEVFEINELINEIIEDVIVATPDYTILFPACPALSVNADRDKIGHVISNFLSNAIKYSAKNKDIIVRCSATNGMLEVSVKDDGIGIKPADQAMIFERYHRIENAHTRKISGFGLGLYLSAEIIRRHGGEVWVESNTGKGSTFFFSLKTI